MSAVNVRVIVLSLVIGLVYLNIPWKSPLVDNYKEKLIVEQKKAPQKMISILSPDFPAKENLRDDSQIMGAADNKAADELSNTAKQLQDAEQKHSPNPTPPKKTAPIRAAAIVPPKVAVKKPAARPATGKISCPEKHDKPGYSDTKGKHTDEDCCPDPDEYPNPKCAYSASSYGILLNKRK